jgi:hypothetical protein
VDFMNSSSWRPLQPFLRQLAGQRGQSLQGEECQRHPGWSTPVICLGSTPESGGLSAAPAGEHREKRTVRVSVTARGSHRQTSTSKFREMRSKPRRDAMREEGIVAWHGTVRGAGKCRATRNRSTTVMIVHAV